MCDSRNAKSVSASARIARILTVVPLVIAALLPARLQAQSATGSSSLAGAVRDPEAKVVVDAAVLIRHETSGDIKTTTTDGTGHFSVTDLPPGPYTIEVAVPGFDIVRRTGVVVGTGRSDEINIALTVANIAEEVTV